MLHANLSFLGVLGVAAPKNLREQMKKGQNALHLTDNNIIFQKFFEVSERENRRFLPLSIAKQFLIKKVLTKNPHTN